MTREEYEAHAAETGDWAPGWEAIESCFEKLYPGQEPAHYGTNLISRAIFGGDCYLDGYSFYQSPNGYKHLVTFGMSELYVNADSFGGEYSKWGYEMTMKLSVQESEECMWAVDMMSNLARYTFTQKKFFEPYQFISGGGNSIKAGSTSKLTGLLAVPDTEAEGRDTLHGRLDFVQLVGITQPELEAVMGDPSQAKGLADALRQDYANLETDLLRTKSYL